MTPDALRSLLLLTAALALPLPTATAAAATATDPSASGARPGDAVLRRWLGAETDRLAARGLAEVRSLDDWRARRPAWRRELADMLGLNLDPELARSDLKATVTGRSSHAGFHVENLHFQSLPGFYVTANLYLPASGPGPFPTILYLSGHGPVISNGVSYGNKVTYQHHGAWFARNGYACLILDSVQLGEIQGLHHGTHREGLWWWNARGYSPAGAEAWNCIRALDYLSTRPEVDARRFGATGRSGGGAYSWWVAALDERIQVAAPVAGITDLRNHVVDGVVEGHCDCMYQVNTYRWDYPQVAALVAPRPLLIVNTDADTIFPLDGVQRLHARVREIYRLHGATDKLGLVIGPGPHKDTQDLQVPVLRWFNRHLRGVDPVIETAATKLCTPEQLRVFQTLPADARNTNIHEIFVPAAPAAAVPATGAAWAAQRDQWRAALETNCFAGWPRTPPPLSLTRLSSTTRNGLRLDCFEFASEELLPLRLYILQPVPAPAPTSALTLSVLDEPAKRSPSPRQSQLQSPSGVDASAEDFERWLAAMSVDFGEALAPEREAMGRGIPPDPAAAADLRRSLDARGALAWLAPRGVGLTAWSDTPKNRVHIRRRFMLLGQTLDAMRVWDIRRAMQALRSSDDWRSARLTVAGTGALAADVLYASLFEPPVTRLELTALPASHRVGPDYLNVLKVWDLPQALAVATERSRVTVRRSDRAVADFSQATLRQLGWDQDRLRIEGATDGR